MSAFGEKFPGIPTRAPRPAFTRHPGETYLETGASGLQDAEASDVASNLNPLDASAGSTGLGPVPHTGPHRGNAKSDCWTLYPCTAGWALSFKTWPSDEDVERACAALGEHADRIHRCDVGLPPMLPTGGLVESLIFSIMVPLGDVPIAFWHGTRLLRRFNNYQKYDPLRGRRGYLSTTF